jgi:hypothetical protein
MIHGPVWDGCTANQLGGEMEEDQAQKALARVEWRYSPDHRVVPCTGVVGGLTPEGDLRVHFYVGLGITPDQIEAEVIQTEEGQFEDKHLATSGLPRDVREIHATIVVSGHRIGSFSNWFKHMDGLRQQSVASPGSESGNGNQ